jgi:hypothetical protein
MGQAKRRREQLGSEYGSGKTVISIEIGKRHFLYHDEETDGSRCNFIPEQGFQLALFLRNPQPEELHPNEIGLGLVVHQRAMFLVVKLGDNAYFDMPYFHYTAPLEQVPAGFGYGCSVAICDETGICRSLGARWLTNKFSNAFVEATRQAEGMDYLEFDAITQSAYEQFPDAKLLFEAATAKEFGWVSLL